MPVRSIDHRPHFWPFCLARSSRVRFDFLISPFVSFVPRSFFFCLLDGWSGVAFRCPLNRLGVAYIEAHFTAAAHPLRFPPSPKRMCRSPFYHLHSSLPAIHRDSSLDVCFLSLSLSLCSSALLHATRGQPPSISQDHRQPLRPSPALSSKLSPDTCLAFCLLPRFFFFFPLLCDSSVYRHDSLSLPDPLPTSASPVTCPTPTPTSTPSLFHPLLFFP